MHSTAFGVTSSRIRDEKSLKYLGTARIEVDVLVFTNSDGPDAENVARLRKLFRIQRDFEPGAIQNRIPAVIDESQLHDAVASSGLRPEALVSAEQVYPTLNFPPGFQLECLRGEDRVEAVKGLFRSSNLRWVVDLFAAGLSIVAIYDESGRGADRMNRHQCRGKARYRRRVCKREKIGRWRNLLQDAPISGNIWAGRLLF